MEPIGYAHIKKNADGFSAISMENFQDQICRIMEYSFDRESLLVVSPNGKGLGDFNVKEHVSRAFECKIIGDYLLPTGLNPMEEMSYMAKITSRKGGYNRMLREMVIQASLAKGKLCDSFLFQTPS